MKVKELIEILKTADPDMEVAIEAPIAQSQCYNCEDIEYGEYWFTENDIDTVCNVLTIGVG